MTSAIKPSLALVLLAALVVAGCTEPGTGGEPGGSATPDQTPPPQMTNAEAQTTLAAALGAMPEAFGIDMKILNGTKEIVTFKGSIDNATGKSYMEIRGDADTLANFTPGQDASEVLKEGFSLYATPTGSLYLVNTTAYVFPPRNESEDNGAGTPNAADGGPLSSFLKPSDMLGEFERAGFNVTSVKPLVYRGKAAVELTVTQTHENVTMTSEITVFTQPRRLARIEMELPADEEDLGNPLAGARMVSDFYYDGEVTVKAPQSAVRALGLSYENSNSGFFGGNRDEFTWTFRNSEGIALNEVEAQVKSQEGQMNGEFSSLPTTFAMLLSDGTKTQGGVTLTFTDADGDGKVSTGDTLRATTSGDEPLPTVVLYDTVTKTHVVPGPGLLAMLALAGLAGLVLRRRG